MKLMNINIKGDEINYKGQIMIDIKGLFNGVLRDNENVKSFIKGQVFEDSLALRIRATQIIDINKRNVNNNDLLYDLIYYPQNKYFNGDVSFKGTYNNVSLFFEKEKKDLKNKMNALKNDIKELQNEIDINRYNR